MTKNPKLAAMVARHKHETAAVTAPLRYEVQSLSLQLHARVNEIRCLRSVIENKYATEITARITDNISKKISDAFYSAAMTSIKKALEEARKGEKTVVSCDIDVDMLMLADKSSVLSFVVEEWMAQCVPTLKVVYGDEPIDSSVSFVRIHIPAMTVSHVV